MTFLTFFVEACRYVGKTLLLEFNLQYRRHLNNNANKYLDSDNAFSYSSQLAEKKSFWFTNVSCLHIFFFFRQRKGAHPMFIRPLVVIACGLLQNGKNIHHLDNVRKVGARV